MLKLKLGGTEFELNPAAISAIRYRAEYGESIVNQLQVSKDAAATRGLLLRLFHMMIPPEQRPPLLALASLARGDPGFWETAGAARRALLAADVHDPGSGACEADEDFDEYMILALMALSGLDTRLIYELPLLHLVAVINRISNLKDTERKEYRPMTGTEMAALYAR